MSQKTSTPADRAAEPASQTVVYDFSAASQSDWFIQNDVVMGGRSDSRMTITEEGHGKFSGSVSLENNGGFASIVSRFDEPVDVSAATTFQLRLLGDGNAYTFRVKADPNQRYWHQFTFPTRGDGEWETISIPFAAMEAVFRGRKLDLPNFTGERVYGLQFLIGNKKPQDFEVLLDSFVAM